MHHEINQEIPEIRLFQFDSQAMGAIKNSVNLFRGDVNFSTPLVELTGRNGLAVKMTGLYQSNVQDSVDQWNLDAPTGVMGLGWTIPYERIEVNGKLTGARDDNDYYLVSGGSRFLMVRADWDESLFSLSADEVSYLNADSLSDSVRDAFLANGLALSDGATVSTQTESTSWRIADDEQQRSYQLTFLSEDAGIGVYSGGLTYQLEQFQFSRISYYAEYERWEIIKADGSVSSYGGNVTTGDDGNQTGISRTKCK